MQNLGGFLEANFHLAKGDIVKFVDANWEPATVWEQDEEWCEPDLDEEIEGGLWRISSGCASRLL